LGHSYAEPIRSAASDEELAKSISEGLATPGAALTMPAKGGNPSLTGSDILSLIAYLRYAFGECAVRRSRRL
jgi:hypothetical protein